MAAVAPESIVATVAENADDDATVSAPIAEKRKPGRPKAWHSDGWFASHVAMIFPEDKSRRAKENRRLAMHALAALRRDWRPEFAWFWSLSPRPYEGVHEATMANAATLRWTLLTELARLDADIMLDAASATASQPLETRTTDAVARLRGWRLECEGRKRTAPDPVAEFARLADRLHERGVSLFDLTIALSRVQVCTMQLGIVPASDSATVAENAEASEGERIRVADDEPRVRVEINEETDDDTADEREPAALARSVA